MERPELNGRAALSAVRVSQTRSITTEVESESPSGAVSKRPVSHPGAKI